MNQGEQLTMDLFNSISTDAPVVDALVNEEIAQRDDYDPLDIQLANLMLELNGKENQCLETCALEISKQTRQGRIAVSCNTAEKEQLKSADRIVGIIQRKSHSKSDSDSLTKKNIDNFKPLILDDNFLYLRRYWQYQKYLAEKIRSRMGQIETSEEQKNEQQKQLNYYFQDGRDLQKNNDTKEDIEINWQRVAAERALENNFLIVSGGPGTGKTTTITRILCLLIDDYLVKGKNTKPEVRTSEKGKSNSNASFNILLAAPTGKAAIRMLDSIREAQKSIKLSDNVQQYLPTQSKTIHKLLGFIPNSLSFKYNRNNQLKADIVLVDEASMIDISLMSKLIEAVPAHAKIILIGDKDQLSSVETGSVFADICYGLEDTPYLVTLKKNWRFSKTSPIGQLAIAVNKGDSNKLFTILNDQNQSECRLLSPSVLSKKLIPIDLLKHWEKYYKVISDPKSSLSEIFNAFDEYRILCALRRGLNGSTELSNRIEATLVKQGLIKRQGGQASKGIWYHGRPIMITQNSYSKGLFNGDTGITLYRDGETKVYFPDKEEGQFKVLSPIRLPAHETTWAMTIHKSQGSEFNQVLLILPHEVMPLLTRQLIYTGVTRAKEGVNIVASEDVMTAGIKTEVIKATRINKLLANNITE